MRDLTVGFLQMDIAWESPDANKIKIEKALSEVTAKPDLFVLPEMCLTGFSCDLLNPELYLVGPQLNWLTHLASQQKTAILGSFKIFENSQFRNRLYLVTPDRQVQSYDKRHLFVLSSEAKNFNRGETRASFHLGEWKIFPQICYDLRFPVWSRNTDNYDLIINVANWPASRRHHWRTLLTARAIENQCFVLGVNRVGTDGNGLVHSGDSLVVDPLGQLLVDAEAREGFFTTTLSKASLLAIREKLPFLKDRDNFTLTEFQS